MSIIPNSKPRMSTEKLKSIISQKGYDISKHKVLIVGIRGYYLQSMGNPTQNDRNLYDDAIFVITPNTSSSFNANTDPSGYRKGQGKGVKKGMATLKTGLWNAHQFGIHKTYEALIQTGGQVTVKRDGNPDYDDTGYFGINIHKGAIKSTSSEGCQTIHPDQWTAFYNLIKTEAKRIFGDANFRTIKIPYLLLNNTGDIV